MYNYQNKDIIENLLIELAQMLNKWEINQKNWVVRNKCFFVPYLHEHSSSLFNDDLEISINEKFIPWELNKNESKKFIPPANSFYLGDFLSFINRFQIEINLFYENATNFNKLNQESADILVNDLIIKQRKPYYIIKEAIFIISKERQKKNKKSNSINLNHLPINKELAQYLYLGYKYAQTTKDTLLLKLINDLFIRRNRLIEVKDFINNIPKKGNIILFLNDDIKKKINKSIIIAVKDLSNKDIPLIIKAGGVICERGGQNNHLAIICREFNIPCVVGVNGIYNKFRQGDFVELDPLNKVIKILKPF